MPFIKVNDEYYINISDLLSVEIREYTNPENHFVIVGLTGDAKYLMIAGYKEPFIKDKEQAKEILRNLMDTYTLSLPKAIEGKDA